MDYYRNWRAYLLEIEEGQKVPENILAYSLQNVTKYDYDHLEFLWLISFPFRFFRVWYNAESWQKVGIPEKILNFFIGVFVAVFWFLVGYEVRSFEMILDNAVEICKTISVVLGACMTITKFTTGWTKREKLSNLILEVDRRVRLSRSNVSEELHKFSIQQYLFFAKVVVAVMALPACMSASIFMYTLVTGEQYYKLALPFDRPPYSPAWWIEAIICQIAISLCNIIYSISDCMWIELILQLAYLYKVEYEQLDRIGKFGDKADNIILCSLCENLKALKE